MKKLAGTIDKQSDMLRLIIQKMEIGGEMCDSDDSEPEDIYDIHSRMIGDVISKFTHRNKPSLHGQNTSMGSIE